MKLHEVIRNFREDMELTQEKLAENANLTRGYISRLEKGEYPDDSPSIKTLKKIAEGLGVQFELLLSKAGITQSDYIKTASPQTFFRAKYNLNNQQTQAVEAFIQHIKKQFKS